jgi:hypothetical protein
MTLTVRLDETLQAALERYCMDHGVSKSLAVQESLAVYLLGKPASAGSPRAAAAAAAAAAAPSANHEAFAAAGLVGGLALGQGADKAAVRARMAASLARRKKR